MSTHTTTQLIEIQINEIDTAGRFRQDFGDIDGLAESIAALGLLQPIVIDTENRLVCGERRLRAFKSLGRETIPARVVDIESVIAGEMAENEVRKDFTRSERVAIGKAIEARIGNRAGQRTDLEPLQIFGFSGITC
jgi:ParB family chromosome partitioning protein